MPKRSGHPNLLPWISGAGDLPSKPKSGMVAMLCSDGSSSAPPLTARDTD